MKAVVAAFNQEKALVGAFSVITNLRMEIFEALVVVAVVEAGSEQPGRARPCWILHWVEDTLHFLASSPRPRACYRDTPTLRG